MRHNIESPIETPINLSALAFKVRGLSEILSMAKGDPPFSEEGLCGFSYLLEDIANELDSIKERIENGKSPK